MGRRHRSVMTLPTRRLRFCLRIEQYYWRRWIRWWMESWWWFVGNTKYIGEYYCIGEWSKYIGKWYLRRPIR
jgi:hypothetical protein